MLIRSAEFVKSAARPQQFLKRPIPHFVFAGRSNVGKSTLLNKLLNRKNLAKTSTTPGKTRLINYFLINDRFFFTDIPGYGYATVSKKEREGWATLIETYLSETPYFGLIFQLLDIRHDPSRADHQMIEWLEYQGLPYRLLLTKADKLSGNGIARQHRQLAKCLDLSKDLLIPTSSVKGTGMAQVWDLIKESYEITLKKIMR